MFKQKNNKTNYNQHNFSFPLKKLTNYRFIVSRLDFNDK